MKLYRRLAKLEARLTTHGQSDRDTAEHARRQRLARVCSDADVAREATEALERHSDAPDTDWKATLWAECPALRKRFRETST